MSRDLTLHEAIEEVLRTKPNREASYKEISEEIARRDLFIRPSDGNYPPHSQISARVNNHSQRFEKVGNGRVRLR